MATFASSATPPHLLPHLLDSNPQSIGSSPSSNPPSAHDTQPEQDTRDSSLQAGLETGISALLQTLEEVEHATRTPSDLEYVSKWTRDRFSDSSGDHEHQDHALYSAGGAVDFPLVSTEVHSLVDRLNGPYEDSLRYVQLLPNEISENYVRWTGDRVNEVLRRLRTKIGTGEGQGGSDGAAPLANGQTSRNEPLSDPTINAWIRSAGLQGFSEAEAVQYLQDAASREGSNPGHTSPSSVLNWGGTSATPTQGHAPAWSTFPSAVPNTGLQLSAEAKTRLHQLVSDPTIDAMLRSPQVEGASEQEKNRILYSLFDLASRDTGSSGGTVSGAGGITPSTLLPSSAPSTSSPASTVPAPPGSSTSASQLAPPVRRKASSYAKTDLLNPSKSLGTVCQVIDLVPEPEKGSAPVSEKLKGGISVGTGTSDGGWWKKVSVKDELGGETSVREEVRDGTRRLDFTWSEAVVPAVSGSGAGSSAPTSKHRSSSEKGKSSSSTGSGATSSASREKAKSSSSQASSATSSATN